MNNKEYLNEEKYQKTSKKLFYIGIGIIALGIVIALYIIITNLITTDKNDKPNKEKLQQQLNQLKTKLETRYEELESNGVKISWNYRDKDGYEMYLIDEALEPTTSPCNSIAGDSNNETVKEYCNIKEQIYDLDNSFDDFDDNTFLIDISPAFIILMPCLAFGTMFILSAKRREITAFQVQQVMPVAQEGIEKMSPTMGNAAKEIAKGVKEGMKDDK